ncbi:copper ABC transporter permease [Mesobacillus boroniphilus]|uniref:Copper ABC transporter permease n=1 Tax=Mesobacillus boroniphilus TaxID=308892 RepID=A0A944GX75_9BACI|nr:ABC transporter permease subunit [Mesobacillus boroniphilus]MBS8265477.1 copper ABC transporter permease [Mesobacillus boroniphilus]
MYFIWKEWKENIRGKGLWLAIGTVIFVSVLLLVRSASLSYDQGLYILLINLFDTLLYFIPILYLFMGAFSIFQEKEQKTLVMLLTRQESFMTFLAKKSLGMHLVLLAPVIIWFFLFLVPLKIYFKADIGTYLAFVLSITALMLIFTQIGALVGSISRSRMQIVGIAVIIWFYFFFLHDFALLSIIQDVTHDNVRLFSIAYFLNPIQAVRMYLETGVGIYSFGHMSRLLKSFMWLQPGAFLGASLIFWMTVTFISSVLLHRKEGFE